MRASHAASAMGERARRMWRSRRLALAGVLLLCSLGVAAAVFQQQQRADEELEIGEIEMVVDAGGDWQPPRPPLPPPPAPGPPAEPKVAQVEPISPPREVNAAWYDVPDDSLAARRAGAEELTAAHNRLPLGTLVRVTHLSNGKSTLVRITDRGIHDKKIKLDVCREAAEELGMVRKGIARVKMEIVREAGGGGSSGESENAAPLR